MKPDESNPRPSAIGRARQEGAESGTQVLARNVLRTPVVTADDNPFAPARSRLPVETLRAIDEASLTVRTVTSLDELRAMEGAWQDLADNAVEPNPFYEPWMALSALEHLEEAGPVTFIAFEAATPLPRPGTSSASRFLCGLVPVVEQRVWGLPLATQRLWKHEYCYLTTPLVRTGTERAVIRALLKFWEKGDTSCVFELGELPVDGPIHRLLVEELWSTRWTSFVADAFTRALFRPADSAESYLSVALSGRRRKEYRRQHARLAEAGELVFDELLQLEDLPRWAEEFRCMEAAGWKGKEGVAVAVSEGRSRFFEQMLRHAMLRERLMAIALRQEGRPIALKLNLLAGGGGYAFKITYDEGLSRFSPGVLLELENIQRLHARTDVAWMDSCASPNRFMINHLWPDRRQFQRLLLAPDDRLATLALSALPMVRWLKRVRRPVSSTEVSHGR